MLSPFTLFAQAPTISYSSPQTLYDKSPATISPASVGNIGAPSFSAPVAVGSGFGNVSDVATDAAGNVYVADYGNNAVKEIPNGTGAPITLAAGLNSPTSIAVDSAGNVYVTCDANGTVLKIPPGGGTPVSIGSGFSSPQGIAVDGSGNVFVIDGGSKTIKEIQASGGSIITIVATFYAPSGLAIDPSGNLYVADYDPNNLAGVVYEITAAREKITLPNYVGAGRPGGLTWANDGTIYVTDKTDNLVYMIPPATNGSTSIGSGFSEPEGTAVDNLGNVYVADYANSAVKKLTVKGGIYISPALPRGLSFNGSTGVISGTPTTIKSGTYTVTAYNLTGSATASLMLSVTLPPWPTLSYATPQTYTPGAPIAPLTPSSTNVDALSYRTIITTAGSGLNQPADVVSDGAGNLYVADKGNNAIKEIPAAGGPPVVIGSGFSSPRGIALDASGNIYVADYGNNAVKEIPAGSNTPVTIGFGFTRPTSVAVDLSGDVYVAEGSAAGSVGSIKEIPAGSNAPIILSTSFLNPQHISIDGANNLYIKDGGSISILAPGSSKPTPVYNYSPNDAGIAIGANGILYYIGAYREQVSMAPAGVYTPTVIAYGFNSPAGMSVDGSGNVYVADEGNNVIRILKPDGGYFVSPALPPGLSVNASTGVVSGTPAVAHVAQNYKFTAYNAIGPKKATVNIIVVDNDDLSGLALNAVKLSPVFSPAVTSYTARVSNDMSSIQITPTAAKPGATITVNGTTVTSGSTSNPIPLITGANTITVTVTASGGSPSKTYTITVGRGPNDAYLANLWVSAAALSPSFAVKTFLYTANVPYYTRSVTVTPSLLDANGSVTVNGVHVANKTASAAIPIAVGANTIAIVGTAQDGVTEETYNIIVTRQPAHDAYLSDIILQGAPITPSFYFKTFNYSATVPNTYTYLTAVPFDSTATLTINGYIIGKSTLVEVPAGSSKVSIVVTAPDGVTTQTYTITITRGPGAADAFAVNDPIEKPALNDDLLVVHQGITPNGDGIDDVFTIDNITNYPKNSLMIMDRNGALIYQAKGYDNVTKPFDGHSNINGKMQLPGTYFFALNYVVKGVTLRKTGFIVLKY